MSDLPPRRLRNRKNKNLPGDGENAQKLYPRLKEENDVNKYSQDDLVDKSASDSAGGLAEASAEQGSDREQLYPRLKEENDVNKYSQDDLVDKSASDSAGGLAEASAEQGSDREQVSTKRGESDNQSEDNRERDSNAEKSYPREVKGVNAQLKSSVYKDARAELKQAVEEFRGSGSTKRSRSDDQQQEPPIQFAIFLICASLVFVAFTCGVWYAKKSGLFENWSAPKTPDVLFKQNLDVLKSRFTNQNHLLWQAVQKLGVDHIKEVQNKTTPGPDRPLVFVFASIKKYKDILTCLALRVGVAFKTDEEDETLKEPSVVFGNEIAQTADSKEILDARLEEILRSSEDQKVVVITELASLSYETASIFFKYCDNEGAPYPKAVFIFTLTMDKDNSFLEMGRKEITSETRMYLSDVVWNGASKGSKDALIARILDPYPFAVMKESSFVLKMCPSLEDHDNRN